MSASNNDDPKRSDKIKRFGSSGIVSEDTDSTAEYMSVIGILFSVIGYMIKMKWCIWIALFCSLIGFTSARVQDNGADTKQLLSGFMLSISGLVMLYLQNPSPMQFAFFI